MDPTSRRRNPARSDAVRCIALASLALLLLSPSAMHAASRQARTSFQRSIIDKRGELNRGFKKERRKETRYVIVHTSEGGLRNTLNVVLNGKHQGRRRITYGGHANYVIARDGRTYRTLDKRFRADHAGLSMWNGEEDLSSISIGIELVGYHHTEITSQQYRSLGILLDILQDIYDLDDASVLTHSQIAYGTPNRWVKSLHRGRKRCAKNFDRSRAGLGPTWPADPDVQARRLTADRELAQIYYGSKRGRSIAASNIITASNTAWMIAGEDFDASDTLYRLPSGRVIPGNQMGRTVGWKRIPRGTEVLLNAEAENSLVAAGTVAVLSNGQSAWTVAGMDYSKPTTLYIFPNGRVKHGGQIADWDGLPPRTRILVGYRGPYRVTSSRPPVLIAGNSYRDARTLYLFPDSSLVSGPEIRDFRRLPRGVRILVPSESS